MLIYIDQNILSVQAKSAALLSLPGHEIAYSAVHFDEISRSSDTSSYICALDRLQAKLLRPAMSGGLPEDHVEILDESPRRLFEGYLQAKARSPIDVAQLWGFLAWLNGGGSEEDIASLPEGIREFFIDSLANQAPQISDSLSHGLAGELEKNLNTVVTRALGHGNDYRANWMRLGADRTGFSQISGQDQLIQIWEVVKDRVPDSSPEAYFGFEWQQNGVSVSAPQILGIVACCGVLDALGFNAEKKRRKAEKQANVQSDAQHIAMASFCDVLFTQDERLYSRAKAIYEFRGINATAIYLDKTGEPYS